MPQCLEASSVIAETLRSSEVSYPRRGGRLPERNSGTDCLTQCICRGRSHARAALGKCQGPALAERRMGTVLSGSQRTSGSPVETAAR
jgi:hypothetical protein